jgi:hypothetical protein
LDTPGQSAASSDSSKASSYGGRYSGYGFRDGRYIEIHGASRSVFDKFAEQSSGVMPASTEKK